jgi:class 3 adenylate cyclase/predicted ATPase/energy-coupling factor transporter ATP-binding protein EcfA2
MKFAAKCRNCGTNLIVGASFCAACGTATVIHCSKCNEPIDATASYCPSCGVALTTVSDVERRQLTVMFCDLVGSTPLGARLDPEEMHEVIRSYQKVCASIIPTYGGFLARFLGDGVLVYFGYPHAQEDAAERAVRAALDMVAAVGRLRTPGGEALSARVGIATGTVVVGELLATGESHERTVVGDAPNLADRIKGLAEPGMVVVASSTRRLLGGIFNLRELGARPLKGYADPVEAWEVVSEADIESRFEAVRPSQRTVFVGRERELAFLLERKGLAWQGKGQVVLITGEPGVGKSRLAEVLAEQISDEPHIRLRFQCSPYHSGSTLYPFTTLITRAAGIKAEDSTEQRLDKLESMLAPVPTAGTAAVPIIATLLSISLGTRYAPLHVSAAQQRRQTFEALFDQVAYRAHRQPVLMIFEDLHWADATSLEFLALMTRWIERLPVLMILTSRPDLVAGWADSVTVSTLALGRLNRPEAWAMTRGIAGSLLQESLVATIVDRTDGIPLFIEESTKAVIDAGFGGAAAGGRRGTETLPPIAVPVSLRDSLTARLDRLSPVKDVAQIGATIGREFSFALLRAVAAMDDAALEAALVQLEAAGLIATTSAEPYATYVFKHALVQEAAYESLLRSRRFVLHRAIAEAIRDRFPDVADKEPEVVARHFTQAGLSDAAIEWWKKAGDQALRRSAYVEAISHLKAASGLAEAMPLSAERQRILLQLQLAHGQALIAQRGYAAPETTAAFVRARELAADIDDATERISVYYGLWVGSYTRSELAPMLEMADALRQEASGRPGTTLAVIADRIAGTTRIFQGDFVAAVPHLEKAVAAYSHERDGPLAHRFGQDLAVAAELFLALTLWPLGEVDRAHRIASSALERARRSGHMPTMAYGHAYMCVLEALRGIPDRAAPHAEALVDISNQHGMEWWRASGTFFRGWARWHAGQRPAALAEMRQGMALGRQHGLLSAPPFFQALAAEAEAGEGRIDEALAMLADLAATIELSGEHWLKSETHRQHGNLLRRRGVNDFAEAESALLTALHTAQQQKARVFELRAALDLAGLYCDLDQRPRARLVLEPALRDWSEDVELREVGQARRLVSSLQ